MNRRDFFKNSSLLAGGLLLSNIDLTAARVKYKPRKIPVGEKVNLACIGIGNRAKDIINELYKTGHCNIVALCDTDMGAEHTLEIIKKFPNAPRYKDFRVMFDKMGKQIDAVCIGTPDHSHFPATMLSKIGRAHV